MPLNILHFVSSHHIGAADVLAEQLLALRQFGTHAYASLSGECEQYPGIHERLRHAGIDHNVVEGLDEHRHFIDVCHSVARVIDRLAPDIIHVHTNWQLAITAFVKRFHSCRFRTVYTIHSYRNNYPVKRLIAQPIIATALNSLADHVIAQSSVVSARFSRIKGKTSTIFAALPECYFEQSPLPDFTAPKRLVFAGQFRHGKNQELLIQALHNYINCTGDHSIQLHLVGDGPLLESCRELAGQLGIIGNVLFRGAVSPVGVRAEYLTCQCAVVASNDETFGKCIAEPFALGRVVFSRPVGVAQDIIRHGVSGFLFHDCSSLSDLLVRWLSDAGRCESISRECLRRRDVLRWRNIVPQLESLYTEVAFGEGGRRS